MSPPVPWVFYAQARRYDAWNGRFVSEDLHKGYKSATYTLNQYSYCWNRPMDYVDNNGKFPWLVIIAVVGTGLLLTGCSDEETTISAESVELPMPTPTGNEYIYKI